MYAVIHILGRDIVETFTTREEAWDFCEKMNEEAFRDFLKENGDTEENEDKWHADAENGYSVQAE